VLSYLVVAAKPGREIPAEVLSLLDQAAPPELAFVTATHVRWNSDHGRLAFAGWQSSTPKAEDHWHVDEHGVTAVSGRMWPHQGMWASGDPWVQQLATRLRAGRSGKTGQPFDGIFTMASLHRDGTGELTTDPLSIAMIYRAESNDLIAYSTRPGLAARAAAGGARPARDPWGCGWMMFAGHVFGDRTGFDRVRVLPLGSHVELHPRFGSRVRTTNPTPWVHPDGLPDDPKALVDIVHEDLLRRVEAIAAMPTPARHRADITGGRDSRLILALIMEAGVADKFHFTTLGAEGTPDSIVGEELATLCSLDFEAVRPSPFDDSLFLRRLQVHSFQTSGMVNAWDLMGGSGVAVSVAVSGLFGEPLKTQFSHLPSFDTTDDLLKTWLTHAQPDSLGILHPEARDQYQRFIVEDLVDRMDSESSLPFDRLDAFYIRNRLRRWGGTLEEIGHTNRVFPLYSLVALQAAFVLGADRRRNEYLHFHVMRDACPMLAEHRFAGRGWRDSLLADVDDPERYAAEPCTLPPPAEDAPRPMAWQADRFERHREIIEAYLLNEPENPLFEVVDRGALTEVLATDLPRGFASRYHMFGALAAAVWLGGHELPLPVGTPDASSVVAHPPPPVPPPPPRETWTRTRRLVRRAPRPVRRALVAGRRLVRPAPASSGSPGSSEAERSVVEAER
jgi:hypothetical protein